MADKIGDWQDLMGGSRIVSMIQRPDGVVWVATEHLIYEIKEGRIEVLQFSGASEDDQLDRLCKRVDELTQWIRAVAEERANATKKRQSENADTAGSGDDSMDER